MQNSKSLNQLLVPIDVSKYFHKAMVYGPRGEILQEPFEIDIYQEGLEKLFGLGHEIQLINPYTTSIVRKMDYDHIKTDHLMQNLTQ